MERKKGKILTWNILTKNCSDTKKVFLTMKHNVAHEQFFAGFESNCSVSFLKY